MFKQFIEDMIHMTEGEKLINYWWLWLLICVLVVIAAFVIALIRMRGKK